MHVSTNALLSCVLFDLDGTLVDTAPDIIAALNQALAEFGLPVVSPERIKPYISFGARRMIVASQQAPVDSQKLEQILDTLHNYYLSNIAEHSTFFDGMAETLQTIENLGLKWGVVTNKLQRFTGPLMSALQLSSRAACVVSGDTAAKAKPYPEPMLEACRQAKVHPETCVYVGDAIHDITAGKSVQMKTLAAVYGYLKPDDDPASWGADALVESPKDILNWLEAGQCR